MSDIKTYRMLIDGECPNCVSYTRLLNRTSTGTDLPYPTFEDDTALLCYTSGTTGRSKGAMITHGNLIHNLQALQKAWQWSQEDVLLHSLPLFHIHGLVVALHGCLLAGATLILLERFDPQVVWKTVERESCTVFMGVPTMYLRLMDKIEGKKQDFSHLRLLAWNRRLPAAGVPSRSQLTSAPTRSAIRSGREPRPRRPCAGTGTARR